MTTTTLATASQVQKWESMYFEEYVRMSGFKAYMGRGANMPIVVKYQLTDGGKTVHIPLITRLTGSGVTGSTTLVGAEEALNNYDMAITVNWLRNAVEIKKPERHWTEMDLLRAAGDMLKVWSADDLRDSIIAAFSSIWSSTASVAYGSATAAQRDAWVDANADRVLFGNAIGNKSTSAPAGGATYDHSASLGNVDSTADKLTYSSLSLMKRMAKTADPHIRPIRTNDASGREYFVCFAGSLPFRDLKTSLATINADARPRDVDSNPIFQDGDLLYDGVIVREIPEIAPLAGVGSGPIDVGPVYFCGAQALGLAWGQEPKMTRKKEDDYGFAEGRGIEECRGIEKLVYNGVDHGLLTGFFSAAADA